jgi:hypothetical protein
MKRTIKVLIIVAISILPISIGDWSPVNSWQWYAIVVPSLALFTIFENRILK